MRGHDALIGGVLIVALWCIGIAFAGEQAIVDQGMPPAAYVAVEVTP